jgi:putative ABC transport system substrate-binding protein
MNRFRVKFFSDNPKPVPSINSAQALSLAEGSAIQNPKWGAMFAFALTFAVGGAVAQAQQPARVARIAYITAAPLSALTNPIDAFRQGLRELGYVEGRNITIEWRSADGRVDRVSALATELVQLKVEVIITGGGVVTRRLKKVTSTIPIVMAQDTDPVGNGFVASLARPGGNITGLSTLAPELSGKRLELLKEVVPKLSRVAVFTTPTDPGNPQARKEIELAATALGLVPQYFDVHAPQDLENVFRAATNARTDAALMSASGPIGVPNRKEIAELAAKNQLPVIYSLPDYVEAGGLMSYGVNFSDLYRRAATYVDKILKGTKPADLPVEQPKKFELVINLKAAKRIGLTIPPNVLARADKVIK